jgi:hypothetical protein
LLCAVIFGHVLASWNPKNLGAYLEKVRTTRDFGFRRDRIRKGFCVNDRCCFLSHCFKS